MSFSFKNNHFEKVRLVCAIVVLAAIACFATSDAFAATKRKPAIILAHPQTERALSADEFLRQKPWRAKMIEVPLPKIGCFTSNFPSETWKEVACGTAPNLPYPPARGPRPQTVGGSNDFAGEVSNLITGVDGSFDSVTGVTSEKGVKGNGGPVTANTFSLQINSKPFTSTKCNASPNANCLGWQQFVYSNAGSAFIQYWLLAYNTACPAGWITYNGFAPAIYCYRNGPNAVNVPVQAITNLATLQLKGTANAGGNDSIIMTTSSGTVSAANVDSMLGLAAGWKGAEFILVGDCCSNQAIFNPGSSIVVHTTVHHGATSQPTCVLEGFTGETNNLNLVSTPASGTLASPAVISNQSNVTTTVASCAPATGFGDTHLTTFNGLLYDFQASGDFVLAQTDTDFTVQNRQVTGKPSWPDAAMNSAVAAKMGKTTVALCTSPEQLFINGKKVSLRDNRTIVLPDFADVTRHGNVYVFRGAEGDSVRAEVNAGNPNYINVTVGLGRWPANVRGLLANFKNDPNQLATSEGEPLKNPFSFEQLYHPYAEGWRVRGASLLNVCGEPKEQGIPSKPFYASDLPKELLQRAKDVCQKAGLKEGPLFEACVLDVAVIGNPKAALVHAKTAPPVVVGQVR
jgi:von Willebrand factor type D domain